jgi:hypothetical protein
VRGAAREALTQAMAGAERLGWGAERWRVGAAAGELAARASARRRAEQSAGAGRWWRAAASGAGMGWSRACGTGSARAERGHGAEAGPWARAGGAGVR